MNMGLFLERVVCYTLCNNVYVKKKQMNQYVYGNN